MKKILSFGGGLQTTALAIMVAQGKLEVDEVVFADTGAEKPETYWYMENYTKPMLAEANIPFIEVSNKDKLYDYCWRKQDIPSVQWRWCTDRFKVRPIHKVANGAVQLIGFSTDESHRAQRQFKRIKTRREFPLIELGLSSSDCRRVIQEYGYPIPLKSSCFICQYQRVTEWNWLKNNHPDLFQKALDLEAHFHARRPDMKDSFGLLGGTPLWRIKHGLQPEMFQLQENSCWSGHCGH